jgi:hypothetical protein
VANSAACRRAPSRHRQVEPLSVFGSRPKCHRSLSENSALSPAVDMIAVIAMGSDVLLFNRSRPFDSRGVVRGQVSVLDSVISVTVTFWRSQ